MRKILFSATRDTHGNMHVFISRDIIAMFLFSLCAQPENLPETSTEHDMKLPITLFSYTMYSKIVDHSIEEIVKISAI